MLWLHRDDSVIKPKAFQRSSAAVRVRPASTLDGMDAFKENLDLNESMADNVCCLQIQREI